jgi:hypothetical protein
MNQLKISEILTVIFFGFIGQLGCWGLMMGGQAVTTLDNALIIHAIGAPFVFILVSFIYFKKFNYTRPLITALSFVIIVILMDFFIVSLIINQNFDMFLSPIGTWIPFLLIFTATSLIGNIIRK